MTWAYSEQEIQKIEAKYGAKAIAFKSADPEAILDRLIKKHPDADNETLRELFTAAIESRAKRDELREAIDLYFVTNNARRLRNPIIKMTTPVDRVKKAAERRSAAETIVKQIKSNFALQVIYGSTREQLIELGATDPGRKKLIKMLKVGQRPSDIMSEAQVSKILGVK